MDNKKKILLICGSNNQTVMLHKIGQFLESRYDLYYTPYYCNGFLKLLYRAGMLEFTVLGRKHQQRAIEYLTGHSLKIDIEGKSNDYDLVITSSDLIIQKNIKGKRIILVQEGMTDPENILYYASRYLGMPRYLASTSTAGLSNAYYRFCVASQGYKEHFVKQGIDPERIAVTGIPNFDDVKMYLNNDFPHRNHVLAATSDARETFKYENRKRFIKRCMDIAGSRKLIFKLHPNENINRALDEIHRYAPHALVYTDGNTNHMIANCDVLITKYSSVVYIGIALGKEVYSDFDVDMLKKLAPSQNGGRSACNIAAVCTAAIEENSVAGLNDEKEFILNGEGALQQEGLAA